MSNRLKSEEISVDIVDGTTTQSGEHTHWPGGDAFLLVYVPTGTVAVQMEVSAEDLGGWVPCGSPITASGCYRHPLPPDVLYRVNIVASGGATGHVDVFEG